MTFYYVEECQQQDERPTVKNVDPCMLGDLPRHRLYSLNLSRPLSEHEWIDVFIHPYVASANMIPDGRIPPGTNATDCYDIMKAFFPETVTGYGDSLPYAEIYSWLYLNAEK